MTPPEAVGTLEVSTQVSQIFTPVCGMVGLRADLPVLCLLRCVAGDWHFPFSPEARTFWISRASIWFQRPKSLTVVSEDGTRMYRHAKPTEVSVCRYIMAYPLEATEETRKFRVVDPVEEEILLLLRFSDFMRVF